MGKIVYLFSDAKNNPLYVGFGAPERPLQWFKPSYCRGQAERRNSRFAAWMIENNFAATWRHIRTGLSVADAREIEGLVIQGIGTSDDGGLLLNKWRGAGAIGRAKLARWKARAGFTAQQLASIPKKNR